MKRIRLIFLWFFIVSGAFSQIVQLQLFRPPAYQLKEADLWRLQITNLSDHPITIYLEGTADEVRDGRIAHARSAVFTLPPGTRMLTANDISPIKLLESHPRYRSIFERTGRAPAGEYTICVIAYDAQTRQELGRDCYTHLVQPLSPPVLIEPSDGDTLRDRNVVFSWTPPYPLSPGQSVRYTLRIVEILGRQSPYDAMLRNSAFFEQSDISSPFFQYPTAARTFQEGKKYAWKVTAYLDREQIGESEVWSFVYVPLKEAVAKKPIVRAIDISTFDAGLAHSFAVRTEKPVIFFHPIVLKPAFLYPQLAAKETGAKDEEALLVDAARSTLKRQIPSQTTAKRQFTATTVEKVWKRFMNGVLFGWGSSEQSQLKQGQIRYPTPVLVGLTKVVDVAAGSWHSAAITSDGKLWSWGRNDYQQCGKPNPIRITQPTEVPHPQGKKFIAVAAGERHTIALDESRMIWAWGININGELGIGNTTVQSTASPAPVAAFLKLGAVDDIAAGVAHSVALAGGQVYGWGSNYYSQIGFQPQSLADYRIYAPRRIEGLRNIIAISAGDYHTLALDNEGYVWAWGRNANGQVHPDSGAIVSTPVRVPGLSDVIDIAAGSCFSVALRKDSTVWVWGNNAMGLTGSDRLNSNQPQQVAGLTGVVRIAAGGSHILALKADGILVAWGNNNIGQLGRGSLEDIVADPAAAPLPIEPVALPSP